MTDQTTETARALLYRHGLPEDVIDGALCLHAQELAAVQRRDAAVWGVDTAAGKHVLATVDLIDPTRGATPVVPLPPADQTTPLREIAAQAIRDAACTGDCGETEEECAKERIQPFAWHHGTLTVVEGSPEQLADAVLSVLPAPVDRAALVRACASFVGDTYSGEWAEDAAATLETDADRIERGESCSLLRLAAVLPATTNHDTAPAATCSAQYHGPGEDRARLCIRAAQHQRTAHTDEHGFHWSDTVAMYPVADGTFRIGTDVRAELRRVADETAATETQAVAPGRRQTVEYFVQSQQPDGTWESASSFSTDLDFAAARLAARREKMPDLTLRLAERTTTVAVRALPDCLACRHWRCDGTGACGALLDAWQRCDCTEPAAGARQDGDAS